MNINNPANCILLVLAIVLTGCGGGGDGGGSSSSSSFILEEGIEVSDSTLRTYQNGETWDYLLEGTHEDGSTKENLSGSYKISYFTKTKTAPDTQTVDTESISGKLTISEGSTINSNIQNYVYQDSNGDMYYYGDQEDGWIKSGPVLNTPGTIYTGYAKSHSFTYENGARHESTVNVVGTAKVETPAGSYETYKIEGSSTITDTDGSYKKSNSTSWFSPKLGQTVIRERNVSYYDAYDSFEDSFTWTIKLTGGSAT
ncbi:hypothetical protein [Thiohalorhabdus denitrificans]|uniref:Uncharacterized protein n=1 Tax=Thiohalorhabdus denitrificans TaxID=381306 RepID=A0A1G5EM39_9GAMM|nr:hypothetical protein [Thiohalorhabdus denitrificans]SCY27994.1 hypothetical protein SAMN05661077_1690 [Thiohalorhabdus denitrificans]